MASIEETAHKSLEAGRSQSMTAVPSAPPSNASIADSGSQYINDGLSQYSEYEDERGAYARERDDHLWSSIERGHREGFFRKVSDRPWYMTQRVTRVWDRIRPTSPNQDLEAGCQGRPGYRISFADVHRAHLRFLQAKLIEMTAELQFYKKVEAGDEPQYNPWKCSEMANELGQTMKDYVQGIRDLEYMSKFSRQSSDPFIASSERQHDEDQLHSAAARWNVSVRKFHQERKNEYAKPTGPWEKSRNGVVGTIAGTRGQFHKKAFGGRVGAAAIGGVFIVIPMWVLSLRTDIVFQLGFTTGCVGLFGFFMVWTLSTISEVFQATLAYAAVLMVFIGVILQTSTSATS